MTNTLDAASLPLRGRHLIEASAGTGKTFTVANLYLRLLIDAQHGDPPTVEKILVVTFTNAATEELRARLRSRIALALQVLEEQSPDLDDPTLTTVLAPHRNLPKTKVRLELAYHSMDQATIFTIHGFCDRMLREQAFESGELFDAELQANVDTLRQRASETWWRESVTPMSAIDTQLIPANWRRPSSVLSRLSTVITDPDGQVVPEFTEEDAQLAQVEFQTAWEVFREAWINEGQGWTEQILEGVQSPLINKGKAPDLFTVDTTTFASQYADEIVEQSCIPTNMNTQLALLGNTALRSSTRKGREPLQSPLGDHVDSLLAAYRTICLQKLVTLQCQAREMISSDLAQRKLLARQRTFDDLLLQLHGVLYGENGERLTCVLRERFPVALIDEFQDTDRIQYEIFDRLYPITEESGTGLYLIGDPKQSIYRFRGADISMYLRARDSTNDQHSLDKNWRSSSRLLNALNALYEQTAQPFGSADIRYHRVSSGGSAEGSPLTVAGVELPPLQFDCVEVASEKLPPVDESRAALSQCCARRVAWLLDNGNASLGSKAIVAKDIALLVSNHIQAQAVRNALLEVGVNSAMQSRESVFNTPEALDLMALLRALARPGDSTSLSRVLVSPLGGYSADELLQQRDDAAAWQRIEDALQRCREQCRQAGPQASVLRFMSLFNSRVKALGSTAVSSRGIDRILGNYLHLADVLQTAWSEQPDLPALLKTAQRWREQGADETLQIRLESDEALVQILTIHTSKGLQYPIVMLPFAGVGRAATANSDIVAYTENGKPRVDVGSDQLEERKQLAIRAEQDEALRTLYVALTRAEQSCWIGVTANKNAKDAALWQLLGLSLSSAQETSKCQEPINEALQKLVNCCADIAKTEALQTQSALTPGQLTDASLHARTASRFVQASWRVGSYSAIARGATHAVEEPDHDAVDLPSERPETIDYNSPFHFPRGAEAGTLVHAVFEHLDFRNATGEELRSYAEKQLRDHGVSTEWTPALCQLVRNTLETPLQKNGFSLSELDKKDRLDELGFHFPVQALNAEKLVTMLRDSGVFGTEDGLSFDQLDGYMTGFIDLTFRHNNKWYIADYKSNHLGYETDNYRANALTEAMQHHRYDLQYLIYSVALRRYLRARLPNFNSAEDFGGVYYLFVRGMPGVISPAATVKAQPNGVYAARPSEDLLDKLDLLLNGDVRNA